ncbi:hypothetical protein WJX72_006940 [[Myrmecia] bisecta]|uniref:Protein kinase domain-containing protein n=1 Tax=[Myrmecia] bisecta TaxID=41462 RepID=A0AAW1R742_9CHLO
MPLANSTYRVVGAGLLPLTPQIKAGLLQAFQVIYSAPRLEIINSWIIPTELATNITQANVSDTYESALAANTTHAISLNGNFGDSNAVPALEAYQSVDITVYAAWHPNSSWPTQGGIEATYNQFTHQLLAQNNITANNFCVHKDITREAAPVIARLGIPQLASYTVALQLVGPQVPPMDALNSLFDNYVFVTTLRSFGLNVSASVLSVMPLPGDSISDQIDSYTGRSNASAAPTAAIPAAAKGAAPVGAIAGGVVAAVVLALIAAVGLFVWQRRRKQAASVSQLGYEKRRSVFAFRGPKDPECRDGVDDLKPPLPLAPGPAGHAEARGETPSLTEFQQAAIRIGVPGMSAVKYAQLDGSSSTNSGSGAYTQPGCSVSTFAPQSSSRTLTDHIAGDFVHGWDVSHDDIELCRRPDGSEWVLGEGSFGMVFRALRSGVQDVAVKTLTRADSHQLQQFRKEISILKSLSFDRNIVQFYGACVQGGKPMLVLEYMEGGDLRQAMSSARGEELRWYNKGQLIALDVARGLHFLHSNKVMHSDLKSKNILLTKDYSCAKIGDVGLARIMNSQYLSNAILGGTFAYAAPELLINARCSEKVDIYSFGVVAWEMATQETPQRGQLRGVKVPEECPVAIAQLIDDCLELDPANRPTARELFDRLRDAYEEGEGGLDHKVSVGSLSTVDTDAARELLNAAVSSKLRPHAITPEAGSSMGSSSWIHDPQGDSDLQSSSTLSADSRSINV